jgi:CheY-like chemotaxis protein
MKINPIGILLKNDSLDVARLMMEALSENNVTNKLSHVTEGIETMAFLKQHRQFSDVKPPGLSMPKMDGREVLAKIKQDKQFKRIPVVILTTSQADEDIIKSY